ncbi:hypothetical protein [Marinoscillum furvescens]|uniref:Uncharacterized protein n=1 Tax=Marinoscillum furvescens DSM 4134 TaxID=1122208 RepID=A0A3D9LKF2_MARFU|nr:hypothetical protein [Marinoscillum furvescens]REE05722.1 hypothetical protein C7460_101240 [Marinoscillum furvescens DSM 4134]
MDIIDVGLYASYILIALCALSAVVIPLIQSFADPQSLLKSGIGVIGLLVVFGIGYGLASGEAPGTTEATSKVVGAGIITMYIMFGVAIVGIVYTEISKIIK